MAQGKDNQVDLAIKAQNLNEKKAAADKRKEKATWLIRMIYLMAIFFVITVFELDGLFYAMTAFFAEIFSGLGDTSTWVASVKGSMRVILVGGFICATISARLIARQRA
jgi:uncharacterized protein YqhQ